LNIWRDQERGIERVRLGRRRGGRIRMMEKKKSIDNASGEGSGKMEKMVQADGWVEGKGMGREITGRQVRKKDG
jgi:hypothetical protein